MCLNPVNEEFDRAYANVGLLASDIWSYQNEDLDYKKANLNLWIRFNDTEKRLIEDDTSDDLSNSTKTTYTVQDAIPFSRLATYNNFEYHEGREKMYVVDDEPTQYIQNAYQLGHNDLEVWMLPEVEKEFKRYTKGSQSGWSMLSPRYPSGRELVSVERITNVNPQQWLSETHWRNRLFSHYAERLYSLKLSSEPSLFRIDLEPPTYDAEELEMKLLEYPCPRYLIETNIDHRLHEIINLPSIKNLWAKPIYSYNIHSENIGLNAEVPEFQPVAFSSKLKVEGESFYHMNNAQIPNNLDQIFHGSTVYEPSFSTRQQHFISVFDQNYIEEVFPYSSPNKYTEESETMLMELNDEVLSNPALINPSRLYFNLELLNSNWKDQQGSSSSNLVALPDSEMNDVVEQQLEPWICGQPYSKNQNTEKMIAFLEKWVSKIYNPRLTDLNHLSSSSGRINKIFQNVQQSYCLVQGPIPVLQPPAHRPLYSDILMSEVHTVEPTTTNSESKFDELEQEALEQYSGSDTTLMIPPQNIAASQNTQQVSGKVNTSQNSSPRQHYEDLNPSNLSSIPRSPESKQGVRRGNFTSREPSQESISSKRSCVSGSKRGNEIESNQDAFHPNKHLKWMKKKKKKTEKKKKKDKHNKTKQPIENPLNQNHNRKFMGSKLMLINSFIDLIDSFKKIFFLGDWKLIEERLTVQVKNIFETCLSTFEDCSERFMLLILEDDSSESFTKLKRRMNLTRKTVSLLENLLGTMQEYIYSYSKIKMTIPCDYRLLFDPNKLIKQKPIIPSQLHVVPLSENNFCYKIGLLATVPNGKYLLRLLNPVVQEEKLTLTFKHKWKLPQVIDIPIHRRTYEIQINFKEWRLHLAPSEMEKEEPNPCVNHKLVKIVEDYPSWYSLQWKFIDGWKLNMNDSYFSFQWCNRFNIKILNHTATLARLFVMYNWLLDLIDVVVLNKNFPSCEVLWTTKTPNLVSRKMVFYRILVQKERNCYFGYVRINQQACCRLYTGCENPCCVTWMLNYDSINTTCAQSVPVTESQKRVVPRVMVKPMRTRYKKDGTKNKKNRSKSRCSSPEKQMIFNEIQVINDGINLPQERSSCVIQ